MSEELIRLFSCLPGYLGGHMLLSAAAIAVGLLVSIPLGICASRRPWLAEYLLGVAGILQTVPTLALLALMVPILGGIGLTGIGFMPAFVALTLYSFLPILASTVTGIRGVDPGLIEAARGLGMSDWQMLTRVQLPLAAPVILSGIRTATVLVVGTATLATPVGGLSLGNYIFSGLNMNDMQSVVFGCVFTALLAIVLDQLVHLLELAVARRNKRLGWIAAGCLMIAVLGGLYAPIAQAFAPPPPVVASAPFTEQFILSEVMRVKLKDAGLDIDQRQGMGETIQFIGLKNCQVDCCINYTGNVWATLMKKTDADDPAVIYEATKRFLEEKYDVECLGKLGFQNNYVLAVHPEIAKQYDVKDIGDLKRHTDKLIIADDMMFFDRNEWKRVESKYELKFPDRNKRSMDPTMLYNSIEKKQVHVIAAYSSDGRIEKLKLRVLTDTRNAIPKYDAILLIAKKSPHYAELKRALSPLVGAVSDDAMKSANLLVDGDNQAPRAAAMQLLASLQSR
jgi:osmoprotectant transport system permease protein